METTHDVYDKTIREFYHWMDREYGTAQRHKVFNYVNFSVNGSVLTTKFAAKFYYRENGIYFQYDNKDKIINQLYRAVHDYFKPFKKQNDKVTCYLSNMQPYVKIQTRLETNKSLFYLQFENPDMKCAIETLQKYQFGF